MNYLMLREVASHFGERGLLKSGAYLGWLAVGFAVFFALLMTAGRFVLASAFAAFFISVAANYCYVAVFKRTSAQLDPDIVEWLIHEAGQAPNAWAEFRSDLVSGLLKAPAALALFLVVRALVHRHRAFGGSWMSRPNARRAAGACFLAFHGLALVLQPSYSMAETNALVYAVPAVFSSAPASREVPVRPARPPLVEKLVVLIDESVTYDSFRRLVEPGIRAFPAIDFGEAASVANCSASSNALLRWGVERPLQGRPGYDPRTNPMIWRFARAAGYRTVLIDGQSTRSPQNHIGSGELGVIDEFIPAAGGMDTDRSIASMVNARLMQPGLSLILVVKRGAHFPYEMNYPAGAVADGAPKVEKHAAAVAYTSSNFIPAMLQGVDLARVLVVYTSDHGQDFSTGGATHCSERPRAAEFSVPLVVITAAPSLREWLDGAPGAMRDRASHLNIFPSLLLGMGYDRPWLEGLYGFTLAGPPSPYLSLVGQPFPTRRRSVMDFSRSTLFPRRDTAQAGAPR